jgi:heptosyltransferase III
MRGNRLYKFIDFYLGVFLLILISMFRSWKKKAGKTNRIPEKILVVKFAALGDSILLIPALRALRKHFPRAKMVMLGSEINRELILQFPNYIDHFINVNVKFLLYRPAYLLSLIKSLRKERYDLAIDFEQWTRITPFLIALSKAGRCIGFKTKKQYRHFIFDEALERKNNVHESINFLEMLKLIGVDSVDNTLELKVDTGKIVESKIWLDKNDMQTNQPLVLIHPGCGTHGFPREWQPERYAKLIQLLQSKCDSFIVLTGTESEQPIVAEIKKNIKNNLAVYTISELSNFSALLSQAKLFISSNTGSMHIAAALQTPQIALHGPTDKIKWGPLNPNAVVIESSCPGCPCLDLGFEYHRTDGFCMEQISFDEVWNEVEKIMG